MANSKQKKTNIQEKATKRANVLECINPNVAGIDVGSSSVYACVSRPDGTQEVEEFPMFTADLKKMVSWFQQHRVRSVAMESTGVYWIPVYDILAQSGFEVLLANAYHLKSVPGRKTDVKDCQWIQQLHSYGLLRGSFRPDNECLPFRTYVRQRTRLFESAATQVQLVHKALTQMNLQLNLVISDITGATGMRIIKAIMNGERNPHTLAALRDHRCKKGEAEIAKALEGNFRPELVFALTQAVQAYDFFHEQILACEKEIEKILETWQADKKPNQQTPSEQPEHSTPHHPEEQKLLKNGRGPQKKALYNRSPYHFDAPKALKRILGIDLIEVPGFDANIIVKIISEIGTDVSSWATIKHFTSWLGLCPGNKISGGKILSSRTKPSANRVAQALRMAASTLYRSQTALGAFFRRMRSRLGAPKAITATAHKLAKILYNMLKHRQKFLEVGQEEYERRYQSRLLANLKRQAKKMGFELVASEEPVPTV